MTCGSLKEYADDTGDSQADTGSQLYQADGLMDFKEVIKQFLGKDRARPKKLLVKELNAYATRSPQPKAAGMPEEPANIEVNEEFKRAFDLIEARTPLLFISGKAGTGKSTFIDYLRSTSKKNLAVVAPTGVAALNAGGQTIHSFFRFPPWPIELDSIEPLYDRRLFEHLRLLVVDEISMVRADLFDAMERSLRVNTGKRHLPFGGVQIVMVGDLFQLPPVVDKKEEARLFTGRKYTSPFFFSAHCLQEHSIAYVEMEKVYRQEHHEFIRLLNAIREGESVDEAVAALNHSCFSEKRGADVQLVLTPTNAVAGNINEKNLAKLEGEEKEFEGVLEGKFRMDQEKLPAPFKLRLKPGAQVMFVKNDSEHRWVNGTMGIVRHLTDETIQVEVNNGDGIFTVQRDHWDALQYRYDETTDSIITEIIGQYKQFPLMLAWAVTIHKSQGQTLDNVFLDLGRGIFAPGQLYVALSRCRTIEGLQLRRPIQKKDVKVDERIKRFYQLLRDNSGEIESHQDISQARPHHYPPQAYKEKNPPRATSINETIEPVSEVTGWHGDEFSWQFGCSHDCVYCHSKIRCARNDSNEPVVQNWGHEIIRPHEIELSTRTRNRQLLLPGAHDITPEHLDEALAVLDNLLNTDNELIVGLKPHLDCVKAICDRFHEQKKKIQFLFSIGSTNQNVLSQWEPKAPTFEERLECLRYAFQLGFRTSVSAEPMLYTYDVERLIEAVSQYCNEGIWLGTMDYLEEILDLHPHIPWLKEAIEYIRDSQNFNVLLAIYNIYKENRLINFKSNFLKIIEGK